MVKLTVATSLAFFQIALLSLTSVGLPIFGLSPNSGPQCPVDDNECIPCERVRIMGAVACLATVCAAGALEFWKDYYKAHPGTQDEHAPLLPGHGPQQQSERCTHAAFAWIMKCCQQLTQRQHPEEPQAESDQGTRPSAEGTHPGSQQQGERPHSPSQGEPPVKRDLMRGDRRSAHDFEKRGWEKFDELD